MRSAAALTLGALLSLGTPFAQTAHADAPTVDAARSTGPGTYLVTLTDRSAAAYEGGVPGYPGTRPKDGARFDRTRPEVRSYRQRLLDGQDLVLDRIGQPTVLYRFTTALDGFAAELTGSQVKQLRDTAGVALVEKSSKQKIAATYSPDFLGLEGAGGVWAGHGGPEKAGAGTVVGVIDTGIWPENPSFAGLPQRSPGTSGKLPGFHGACARAEQWSPDDCNDKVVSARSFLKGFGSGNVSAAESPSPRDGNGHGSHTAATAAGNHGVAVTIEGQDAGNASGMAPAARIAVYKACWAAPDPDNDGCDTADTVAAIDRAVADGVDVLNYAISGNGDNGAESVQRAFLNAASAGVFVATSAGNDGPEAATAEHSSPWVTTVGASTHRLFQGSVRLGDGSSYVGAMVSDESVPSTGIVLSSEVGSPSATAEDARLCQIGALDAEKAQDKIVVCDRGVVARVDKSAAVARAGGAGMVLINTEPDSTDSDFHAVPTVHVDVNDATDIVAYVQDEGKKATASLDPNGSEDIAVPQIAEFSSRGPAPAWGGDVLKPDLTAPGVSVVGAVAPPSDSGRLWDLYSGTSMSASHVAGLAAFIRGVNPTWSPARIKSAMMTTAYDLEGAAGPFAEGAGHINPAGFLDPGLVYDSGPKSWRALLSGRLDATDLNLPSIAVGALVGRKTLTRRVTNVSTKTESYSVNVTGLNGVHVRIRPTTLTLSPGQSQRFRVTMATEVGASLGQYAKGALTWTGLTHKVRIPVVTQPVAVSAPGELSGSGESGSLVVRGTSGTGTPLDLSGTGLVPANPTGFSLVPGAFNPAAPRADAETFETSVEVPAATDVARFEMSTHNNGDDVDLYVYRDGQLVAGSATSGADESVTLIEPAPGKYTLYVAASSAANGSTTTAQLYTWVVGESGGTELALTPDSVHAGPGQSFRYSASWDGLDMTQRWLGAIRYGDSGRRTLITVG